jgi:hypothetical protein
VRVAADGSIGDFATRADGLDAVLGLRVDRPRGLLWALSDAYRSMEGFDARDAGRAALVGFDLDSGAVRERLLPPAGSHLLNDVAIGPDGTAYVTDSETGVVWSGRTGERALVPFVPAGMLRYPNGIACDGTRLFVAHLSGVAVVPLTGGVPRELVVPDGMMLGGFDGLYTTGDMLLGVQNTFGSPRVLRVDLDAGHTTALRVAVLESAHPALATPMTGALVTGERRLRVVVRGDQDATTILSIPIDD